MDPIKIYKCAGYTVRLFPNRIEIEKSTMFGKRIEVILLRTVTNVTQGIGKLLEISTSDGKKYRLSIGGKAAREMQDAILVAIP